LRVRLTGPSALECNCSICAKKGFINLIVAPENFELPQGEALPSSHRFNTRVAEHRVCPDSIFSKWRPIAGQEQRRPASRKAGRPRTMGSKLE
jgi:hypothetical protein